MKRSKDIVGVPQLARGLAHEEVRQDDRSAVEAGGFRPQWASFERRY